MLATVIVLNLASVYMSVVFNGWYKSFNDALQAKDEAAFWAALLRFSYLAFGAIVISVYATYLQQLLTLRWRTWMTAHYLQRWTRGNTMYQMELGRYTHQEGNDNPRATDNPDQRIQVDVDQFIVSTLSLCLGFMNSVVTLCSFVGILWVLSEGFGVVLGGVSYTVQGFMLWMALLYSVAGSVITHYVGRPQISLNYQQQRVEADFRHHMVRSREYAESITLERGQAVELQQMELRFSRVAKNYLRLIGVQKRLGWFTTFFGQVAAVFPYMVAAPHFFRGPMSLGDLTQVVDAFGNVQGALSWFVNNYNSLASWRATTDRLTSFEHAISEMEPNGLVDDLPSDYPAVTGTHLQVQLPQGGVLLAATTFAVKAGDNTLVNGPSGAGKSTLFRTLAGIWPHAQGHVELPADSMFLPQQPYFPNGPLRDALAYPLAPGAYSDRDLQSALREAGLESLCDSLDTFDSWNHLLSGGEQQKLALARVFLKKPRWVFADEATSALDATAEAMLYQRLADMVEQRGGAMVSIAHRPSVAMFHKRLWVLEPQPAGASALFKLEEKPA